MSRLNVPDILDILKGEGQLYLADASTVGKVQWRHDGQSSLLCLKATEPPPNTTSNSTTAQKKDKKEKLTEGTFTICGVISPTSFFLRPDGFWKEGNSVDSKFRNAKANCVLLRPENTGTLTDDWSEAIKTILKFEQMGAFKGATISSIKEKAAPNNDSGIVIKWVLFERKGKIYDDEEEEEEEADSEAQDKAGDASAPAGDEDKDKEGNEPNEEPQPVLFTDWSDIPATALNEYKKIEKDYEWQPLRAYYPNGEIVRPDDYAAALRGATVRLQLAFRVWHFGGEQPRRTTHIAEIREINILKKATPISSPMKRRNPASGPTPVKKARHA